MVNTMNASNSGNVSGGGALSGEADIRSSAEIVRAIREVLAEQGRVGHEYLVGLAERYSRACDDMYKKVYRCQDLLQSGQKKAASRLAKASPDLKEEFEALDFVEIGTWLELCENLALVAPPFLDGAAISLLVDELYNFDASASQLDGLLRRHRRMAMGRAPIHERLRILREILKADTNVAAWKEDVKAIEAAWMGELAQEATDADRLRDLPTLERILADVKSEGWLSAPSSKFTAAMEQIIRPHRQRRVDEQCRQIAEQLRDAHGAMDEGRCRDLLDQWHQVCEETGCRPSSALAAEIQPIQSWLDDLDAERHVENSFQDACMALETAIDELDDQASLEKLAAAILRFDREMPPLLAARFNSRMDEITRTGKRKFALKLTGLVGALLLVAGITVAATLWYGHRRAVGHWNTQVASLLERGALDEAGGMLAKCEKEAPAVYASAEIQGLQARLRQAVTAENQRRSTFQALLDQVSKAGVEKPAEEDLAKAESLAKTADEKRLAWEWKRKIQEYKDEQARLAQQRIAKKIQEIDKLHEEFKAAAQDGQDSEMSEKASSIRLGVMTAMGMDGTTDSHRSHLKAVEKDVVERQKKQQDAIEQIRAVRAELAAMAKKIDDPNSLAKAMQDFAKERPDHPYAADFLRAAAMSPYWKAAANWSAVAGGWTQVVPIQNAKLAKQRMDAIDGFLKANPDSIHVAFAKDYRAYLAATEKVWSTEGQVLHATARRTMASPLLNELYVLKASRGRNYYLKDMTSLKIMYGPAVDNSKPEPIGYTFNYIIDGTLAEKDYRLKNDLIVALPKEKAPQAKYAAEAMKLLGAAPGVGWETLYLRVAELTLKDKEMDPILRALLVKSFLTYATQTTPVQSERIQLALSALNTDLDLAWMDPGDSAASRRRPEIATILSSIESIEPAIKEVQQKVKELADQVNAHKAVGLFVASAEGITINSELTQGSLHVLVQGMDGVVSYRKIGDLKDGRPVVDGKLLKGVPKGTPIYVRIR